MRSGHDGWRAHEALAARRGRVLAVGSWADVRGLRAPGAREVDLDGGCALPGLADAHCHLLGYALARRGLAAGSARSREGLLGLVRAAAAEAPPGGWLVGRGWDEEAWPDRRPPSREELDAAAGGRPALVARVCGHAAIASTAALARAGLEAGEWPLREAAMAAVAGAVPRPGRAEARRLLRAALRECRDLGIAQVQTDDVASAGGLDEALALYGAEAGPSAARVRVTLMLPHGRLAETRERGVRTGWGDAWLRAGHVKVFADGSLGARTAALRRPYADDPGTRGTLLLAPDELREAVTGVHRAGCQLGIHAIGDRALHAALEALAEAQAAAPRADARHRLIHCQITGPDTLAAMRAGGVVADIQPAFWTSDAPWLERRVGPDRAAASYAWRAMLDLGIPACGGSDCPIEPLDPMRGIAAAVERGLTVAESLDLLTRGAAYATFEEGVRGSLAPGMAADVTALDGDPFEAGPAGLGALRARLTLVGGA